MARYEFKLPDIGEGVAEAEIVEWHVKVGDTVSEGQAIASVMTHKATVELEAPVAGTIVECHGKIGESLPIGAVLVAFETANPAIDDQAAPVATEPVVAKSPRSAVTAGAEPRPERAAGRNGKRLASPAVRGRAMALGVDIASVPAAGERLTHADLDRYIMQKQSEHDGRAVPKLPGGVDIPVVGVRRQIARHMQEAKRHIPHFTYVEEVDVTALEAMRARLNTDAGDRLRLSFLPFLVAAMCRTIKGYPSLNARYDDQREVLTLYGPVHAGIATHTDNGLVVPVLRDADGLAPRQIAEAIARLAEQARAGQLSVDEMSGSTITITSLGKLGGITATPIINWPEVAILAPGRIVERPVWLDDRVQPRKILNISIACDHRIVDGAVAAAFVQDIKRALEAFDETSIGIPLAE